MTYIFFGWLLVFIHFRINGFDILPDFAGYGLIFAGVDRLSARSNYFNKARIFSVLMGIVSFGELFHLQSFTIESELFFRLFLISAAAFSLLVPLYLMYLITKGVAELEWDIAAYLGADTLMHVWKVNALVTLLLCAMGVLSVILLSILAGIQVLAAVMMVCVLLVNIAWVICFYGCKKRYDTADDQMTVSE